jgi:hypothetical protein
MWYQFLNIFFFVFHTAFTLFNAVGWAFRKTRRLHLVTLLLTVFSWFVLGIWFGWGYCVCTEWHWQVREILGFHDKSNSYIHFLLLKLTRLDLDQSLVEHATLILFLLAFGLNILFSFKDKKKA